MTEMIYGVKVKKELFAPDECATLMALDFPWELAQVSSGGVDDVVSADGKTAEYKRIPLETETEWIYQRLSELLKQGGAFGFEVETIDIPLKV